MAYKASDAIDRALEDMGDSAGTTWRSDTFMLRRVKDGLAEIVNLAPQSYTPTVNLTLVANVSRQTLPANNVRLVRIVRNMGADGATPGRRIRITTESELDAVDPLWHQSKTRPEIRNWVYDEKVPGEFYVYPRPNAALQVEAVVVRVPTVTAVSDDLPIADIYFNALVSYLKFRAYDRAGNRRDTTKAQYHYTAFERSLGIKKAVDAEESADKRQE